MYVPFFFQKYFCLKIYMELCLYELPKFQKLDHLFDKIKTESSFLTNQEKRTQTISNKCIYHIKKCYKDGMIFITEH